MGLYQKIKTKIREKIPFFIAWILILLCVCVFLFNRIVIIVEAGEGGVQYKLFFGGTVTTKVYGEGIHVIYPWNSMHIYNIRYQQEPHEFNILTKNGLKVEIFISIRYRPEYNLLGVLHQSVGPEYVDVVVIPEIENVLRVLIGKLEAEEVYTTKQAIIEKSISYATEQIAKRFVKVDDVIIKRMQLPSEVEEEITEKMKQKHKAAAYKFKIEREKKELERKTIEAEALKILHKALTKEVLHWKGIEATLKLAESENAKTLIIGSKDSGLPIIGNLSVAPYTETGTAVEAEKPPETGTSTETPETPPSQDQAPEQTGNAEVQTQN
ncbi:MAG: prohibitin family protein [Desulfobacterales bacterium]|nr:prohibitin family protein [Desulfobacterales bacterium]